MRTRPAKPGFFKDEDLAGCEPMARILFLGLACLADADGRLKDKPGEIKAEVLPHDKADVNTLLGQLASRRLITRYEVGGVRYIQVSKSSDTFRFHARPHQDEKCDNHPAPPIAGPEKPGDFPASCSLTPLLSNSFPFAVPPPVQPASRRRAARESAEGFDEFWNAYPRKEAKAKAVEAWDRLKPDPLIRRAILDALERQRISDQWTRDGGRYIPLPTTYLNQRRWEDDLSRLSPGGVHGNPVRSAAERTAARCRSGAGAIGETQGGG